MPESFASLVNLSITLLSILDCILEEGILLALLHSTVMIKPNNNTLPLIGFFHL